ncbi:PREDICTED: cytochrome P450 708A2-like [Camelina sativa]|uniref:Cytochrome P450 708A2-like n=1 Tax=Camelina sativa TaxID=90675 RepID=A0ABM1QKZ0_CAMSA|nr:PREDICTED: cytochrome P450 708A2-like [Camelina sativa]
MVEFYELLLAVVVSLIVVTLFHWIYQWRNPKINGKLPPGSMGFPIIGDTFEFMKPHDVLQFPTFIKERVLRYGPVFRTSLFGSKAIISLDFELNLEIVKANHVPGTKYLKLKMVEDVDVLARTYMEEGARNGCLDVKETASKILIECLAKKVMGEMEPEAAKELALCWRYFPRDWFQFSWNIPGTSVYRMMKARKRMMKLIKETVLKKRASGEEFGEFFKIIFGEMEGGAEKMSVENAIEYIYTFFLIANETTPGILAATVKFISDHPNVMQELQREHDRVVQGKPEKEAGLTWEDYKSMTFTQMVIYESLRITSTAPTVLRITDHDFQVGDYTIPAGWIFMGYANVHFNPEKYDDPLAFDPWRWKSDDLGSILSKSYIPFGAGSRLCVGAEFAKLQMAIFIHHLFRYRWSMKKETTVLRRFMLMFPCGSDVQFSYDTKVDNNVGYQS